MATLHYLPASRVNDRAKPSRLVGHFFSGLPAKQQAQRIRELANAGLSSDFIALITRRGINAVRNALVLEQRT